MIGRGLAIHWPDIDEEISVPRLFALLMMVGAALGNAERASSWLRPLAATTSPGSRWLRERPRPCRFSLGDDSR
ncbi:MAG TPA: hypothetical protein VGQ78_03330 [Vicinamibacteria bacterium]|nr:hypothetical protein [Vicinamibacteria bacterium]